MNASVFRSMLIPGLSMSILAKTHRPIMTGKIKCSKSQCSCGLYDVATLDYITLDYSITVRNQELDVLLTLT